MCIYIYIYACTYIYTHIATVAAFMITRQHTKSPSISANKWVALLV